MSDGLDALMASIFGEETAWQKRAACLDADPELFFGEGAHDGAGRVAAAKRVCFGCPVREECLEHALRNNEAHGVWGGTSERERRRLRRQRAATQRARLAG